MREQPTQATVHGTCPSDELLLAYLSAAVSRSEQGEMDAHVEACDRCMDALIGAQLRLGLDAEMAEAVPPAASESFAAVSPPQTSAGAAGAPPPRSITTPRRRA